MAHTVDGGNQIETISIETYTNDERPGYTHRVIIPVDHSDHGLRDITADQEPAVTKELGERYIRNHLDMFKWMQPIDLSDESSDGTVN
mgnify:CR=1 FL=1